MLSAPSLDVSADKAAPAVARNGLASKRRGHPSSGHAVRDRDNTHARRNGCLEERAAGASRFFHAGMKEMMILA